MGSEPVGEINQIILIDGQRLVRGVCGAGRRRWGASGGTGGEARLGGHGTCPLYHCPTPLKHSPHGLGVANHTLKMTDVFDGGSQSFNFAHFLGLGALGAVR